MLPSENRRSPVADGDGLVIRPGDPVFRLADPVILRSFSRAERRRIRNLAVGRRPCLAPWLCCLAVGLAAGSASAQEPPGPGQPDRTQAQRESVLALVPDLRGHRFADLPAILQEARLRPGEVSHAYSNDPEGTILDQNPGPGSHVRRGTPIAVTVSLGPEPEPPLVPVPGVVGRTLADARRVLAESRFRIGDLSSKESEAPAGTVVEQSPLPLSMARRGTAVNLILATPIPLVPVPNLQGLTEAEGGQRLAERSLAEGEREARYSSEAAGTIIDQAPPADSMVARGTRVARVVSIGPLPPTPTPEPTPTEEPTPTPEPLTPTAEPTAVPTSPVPQPTPSLPPPPPPSWLNPVILGAAALAFTGAILLATVGLRRLTKRGRQREEPDKGAPGIEVRAVRDEGSQRVSRPPSAVSVGVEVHPDQGGRQSVRTRSEP